MTHITTTGSGDSVDLGTPYGQYKYVARSLTKAGIGSHELEALANLYATATASQAIARALRDAISTYTGADKIVTAERIECWLNELKKSGL